MTIGLLAGQDLAVAAWTWQAFHLRPHLINGAYGLVEDNAVVGSAIFHNYNGVNIEFSYYGKDAITLGVFRELTKIAIERFDVERCTLQIRLTNTRLINWVLKMGATCEGTSRRYYGKLDSDDNASIRFVIFREVGERWLHRRTFH